MGLVGFSTQKLLWGVGTHIIHEDGMSTFVRLYIIRPTPHADKTARIYQLHVYRVPENP